MATEPILLDRPALGEVTLALAGATYVLRPVTLEELEEFVLGLADINEPPAPNGKAAKATAADADPPSQRAQLEKEFADRRLLVAWWRSVIARLAPPGSPPLPDDGLPAWLSSGELVGQVIACWQGSPLGPGAT